MGRRRLHEGREKQIDREKIVRKRIRERKESLFCWKKKGPLFPDLLPPQLGTEEATFLVSRRRRASTVSVSGGFVEGVAGLTGENVAF